MLMDQLAQRHLVFTGDVLVVGVRAEQRQAERDVNKRAQRAEQEGDRPSGPTGDPCALRITQAAEFLQQRVGQRIDTG